jgi:hypothetical protein
MKRNVIRNYLISLFVLVVLSFPAHATLEITVDTNKDVYQVGETVEVYISVYNPTAEDITLNMANPPTRYLMDEAYFWHQNMVSISWAPPLDTILIQAGQALTWQLDHDAIELAEYTLGVGVHTVRGYVYSIETIGQYSELVEFQIIPEPITFSLLFLGGFFIKRR